MHIINNCGIIEKKTGYKDRNPEFDIVYAFHESFYVFLYRIEH